MYDKEISAIDTLLSITDLWTHQCWGYQLWLKIGCTGKSSVFSAADCLCFKCEFMKTLNSKLSELHNQCLLWEITAIIFYVKKKHFDSWCRNESNVVVGEYNIVTRWNYVTIFVCVPLQNNKMLDRTYDAYFLSNSSVYVMRLTRSVK
jgi:hypothetical protein